MLKRFFKLLKRNKNGFSKEELEQQISLGESITIPILTIVIALVLTILTLEGGKALKCNYIVIIILTILILVIEIVFIIYYLTATIKALTELEKVIEKEKKQKVWECIKNREFAKLIPANKSLIHYLFQEGLSKKTIEIEYESGGICISRKNGEKEFIPFYICLNEFNIEE